MFFFNQNKFKLKQIQKNICIAFLQKCINRDISFLSSACGVWPITHVPLIRIPTSYPQLKYAAFPRHDGGSAGVSSLQHQLPLPVVKRGGQDDDR